MDLSTDGHASSQTYQHMHNANSSTQKLKSLLFILQDGSNFRTILAKK